MRPIASILGLSLLLTAVAVLHTACENRSADDSSLRVEPQAIGIRINEAIDFNASGGFSYDWSLSDDTLGVLTTKKGPTTRYISRRAPEAGAGPMVQRLTVTSVVGGHGGDGTGTNVTDLGSGFVDTAEAVIEHLPSPTSSGGGGNGNGNGNGDGTVTTTTTTTTTLAGVTTTGTVATTTLTAVTTTPTTTAPFFPPLP